MADPSAMLTFNGINGSTGRYDIEPMTLEAFSQVALGRAPLNPEEAQHLEELKLKHEQDSNPHFAPKEGVDRKKLEQTGWGVIFAYGADPAIYEALSPLLQLRKQQAGDLYKEFLGPDAYRPGETKNDFLTRHGMGPGPADPKVVPYYLLIVGDPDSIPFRFQYQLDVQYGVGRIHFDATDPADALARYAAYARSVVEAETGKLALPRRAAFFGTANPGDAATLLSHDQLALPLAAWAASRPGWSIDKYLGGDATKARLSALLGREAPAFLFTASHGMCYNNGDPRQLAEQGALLCQDWPGPSYQQPIPGDFFFSGEDLAGDAKIFGSIAMHFACFGAGTPQLSDYSVSGPPPAIAPHGFLGRLPQRLIGHPRGGALAVIGHVERAWGYSFSWDKAEKQTAVFESTIQRLMEGHPVGSAVEYFNERYAELSSDLSTTLEDVKFGKAVNPYLISGMWTANNDARGYSVVGDPAVRLVLAGEEKQAERPVLEVVTVPAPPAPPPPPQPPFVMPMQGQAGAMNFGFMDPLHDAAANLQAAAQKIGAWLADSFQNVTTVKVATYVSDQMNEVHLVDGALAGGQLRAITIASLDGNTVVCVPEQDGKVDDALWKIHSEIVDKALKNRVEMLRAAAAAIVGLIPGGKAL
jgi:hypothetical protein